MKLTNQNITDSISKIEEAFPDHLKTRLMAEEILLNFRDRFSSEAEYTLTIRKLLSTARITIRAEGEEYDPITEDTGSEFSILNNLLVQEENKPAYHYRRGVNEVVFSLQKKEKTRIPGGKLTIAVLLALVCGFLSRFLPKDILYFLLVNIIEPLAARLPKLVAGLTIPLIFISILAGICALDETSSLSTIGVRVLKRFAVVILFILAVTFPLCMLFFPGTLSFGTGGFEISTLVRIFLEIIPVNFFTPFTEANAVQVVFIAFIAGIAILSLGERAGKVRELIPDLNTIVMQMMRIVAGIIPFTVFLSLFKTFAANNLSTVLSVWKIIAVNLIANILVSAVLLARLAVLRKVNIREFLHQISPLLFSTFASASTSAVIPKEYTICEEELKVDKMVYSFWIPLAHAMFSVSVVIPLFAGVFYTAYNAGMSIPAPQLVLIVLLILELTIASPKIPGGIIATYTLLFTELGLPADFLGLLMAANVFIVNFEVMNEMLIKYCDLKDLDCLLKKENKA
ncbi:MAG: cation:dicarboxylase symporter family transporter [Solobacterium sp.]|nr:cation:dicarboxylase symporter family transporter [Solobacterium sp.]